MKLCFNGSERNAKSIQPSWTGCDDERGIYNGAEFDAEYDFENDPNNYAALINTFVEQNHLLEYVNSGDDSKMESDDDNYKYAIYKLMKSNYYNKIDNCTDITSDTSMIMPLQQELRNVANDKLGLKQRWFEYCKIESINFIKQKFIDIATVYGRTLGKDLYIYELSATNRIQMERVFSSCMRQVVVKSLPHQEI